MSDDFIMRCPQCKMKTKYIVKHLGASKTCNENIDIEAFKYQFKIYKSDKAKKDHAEHQRVYKEKMMKLDGHKAKRDHAEHQRVYRERIMKLDVHKAKRDNAEHQRVHRERPMKVDGHKAKRDHAEHQRVHREKMIKIDENKVKKELGASRKRLCLGELKTTKV